LYRQVAPEENPLTFDASRRAPRGVSPKKAKRLRIAWFVLGSMFGALCTSGIHWLITDDVTGQLASGETIEEAIEQAESNNAEAEATAAAVQKADLPPQTHFTMEVSSGDTLMDMLTRKGVEYQEAHNLIAALRKEYNPRRLVVGQELELQLTEAESAADYAVDSLRIRLTPVETLELRQTAKDDFALKTLKAELSTELAGGGGVINSSLYQTGIDSGVPPVILGTLINAYSYDVDFQREIRSGDQFNVVFERLKTDDDITAGYGKLLYATLTLGGEEKRIYLFTRKNGDEDYYDENGQSVRKALLRTPVNGARLSSGFGMRRHPVLGYGKMHKGVDFAAPTGTPIYAAGDGTVEYAARYGSFGNYVRIRHTNEYKTAYAHMHRIAAKKGARVKQGQVIGYVGTTGRSTGPHLHYEVHSNGKAVNPKNIKFPTGHKLKGNELASFRENTKQIDLIAARLIKGESQLAKAD
jgi:murein DD-endopeptidase MepM/ murein hydrolase activator NlpD